MGILLKMWWIFGLSFSYVIVYKLEYYYFNFVMYLDEALPTLLTDSKFTASYSCFDAKGSCILVSSHILCLEPQRVPVLSLTFLSHCSADKLGIFFCHQRIEMVSCSMKTNQEGIKPLNCSLTSPSLEFFNYWWNCLKIENLEVFIIMDFFCKLIFGSDF